MTVEAIREAALSSRARLLRALFLLGALVSLSYAVFSAPKLGIDLRFFQQGAREWVDGIFHIGDGPIGEYPPFALPMFAPIAFVPFDKLLYLWLGVKVAATATCLYLAIKLWGSQWTLRTRVYLSAFLLTWSPFRVSLRNGQISLLIVALLLGSMLARKKGRQVLAGILLGLSLCKYSLTFPFLLYFVWRREWKLVGMSVVIPLLLTEVFAVRLGMSLFEALRQYTGVITGIYLSGVSPDMGTSEIKVLFFDLSGNGSFASILTLLLSLAALFCMGLLFSRKPRWEIAHFSALALFSLWSCYHRTYDAVICLLPAALLVDMIVRKKFVGFGLFWLSGLGLLILSIPGVLIDRLKMSAISSSDNLVLMLGAHIERLLIFGMFWSLLYLLWQDSRRGEASEMQPADSIPLPVPALTTVHESPLH